eukprot:TRINITY_DN426_c5_g1_i1.p1 TRINITY_DN426_c5_g1~~TRINITY_DN426_c5_g1_i1.p1  ORF type:complete len:698 (-),score=95.68 TRINITY_DN426_c5_g1_i1:100-2193(-)
MAAPVSDDSSPLRSGYPVLHGPSSLQSQQSFSERSMRVSRARSAARSMTPGGFSNPGSMSRTASAKRGDVNHRSSEILPGCYVLERWPDHTTPVVNERSSLGLPVCGVNPEGASEHGGMLDRRRYQGVPTGGPRIPPRPRSASANSARGGRDSEGEHHANPFRRAPLVQLAHAEEARLDHDVPSHVKFPEGASKTARSLAVTRDALIDGGMAGLPTYQLTPRKKAQVDTLDHLCMMRPQINDARVKYIPSIHAHARENPENPKLDLEIFSGAAGKRSDDPLQVRRKRTIRGAHPFVDEIVYQHQPSEALRPWDEASPVVLSKSGHDVNQYPKSFMKIADGAAGWPTWVEPACRGKMQVEPPEPHTSRKSCTHLPFTKRRYTMDAPMAKTFFDKIVLGRDICFSGHEQYDDSFNRMHDGAAGVASWYTGDREQRETAMTDRNSYDPPSYPCEQSDEVPGVADRTHSPRCWTGLNRGARGVHPFGHQVEWWPSLPPDRDQRAAQRRSLSARSAGYRGGGSSEASMSSSGGYARRDALNQLGARSLAEAGKTLARGVTARDLARMRTTGSLPPERDEFRSFGRGSDGSGSWRNDTNMYRSPSEYRTSNYSDVIDRRGYMETPAKSRQASEQQRSRCTSRNAGYGTREATPATEYSYSRPSSSRRVSRSPSVCSSRAMSVASRGSGRRQATSRERRFSARG